MNNTAALFCIDSKNYNQAIVAIHSFSSFHKDSDILIACHSSSVPRIKEYTKTISNSVIFIEFLQEVTEEFLVAKFLEQITRHPYKTVVYLNSSTVLRKPAYELFMQDMGENLISASREYTFWNTKSSKNFYKKEDDKAEARLTIYGMEYINAGVVVFNVENILRDGMLLDTSFQDMFSFSYYVDPSLSEFLSSRFSGKIYFNSRTLNDFGDRYLVNIKPYNKIIRSLEVFKRATVMNFSFCKPWSPELRLNRSTLQYPVNTYKDYVLGTERFLDREFLYALDKNTTKWEKMLGSVPTAFYKYYGG